jgi:uncharacterized membrane protein YhaH (DUF805 family)
MFFCVLASASLVRSVRALHTLLWSVTVLGPRISMMAKHLREMQKSEREHQKWTQHPPVTQKHGTTGPDQ